jgi:hypothetical protein
MPDVLFPFGMFLLIVFLVYLMIHTSRKQRDAKKEVFTDFANRKGFSYQEKDDGTVQEFARDFDGIGRFKSSSFGKVIPQDVVSGTIDTARSILFRHRIRYGEGWGREWFVAGIVANEPLAPHCAVQFCKRRSEKHTMYLGDAIIKEQKFGPYVMVVRAPSLSDAGKLVNEHILEKLAGWAEELSFRPEIQIRGKHIISYLADKNATVGGTETLEALFEFTIRVSGV